MAQVPYNEGVPSVLPRTDAPEDYQRLNANPTSFGSAIGAGLERAGQGATQAAKTYQEVSAQQAANNFEDESNKLVYGDPTKIGADGQPDRGLLGTRGEDALTKEAEVRQQVMDLRDHYKDQMSTADQQLYFNNQSSFATRRLLTTIGAHYDAQFGVYQEGVNQAQANTALNLVAQAPNDPASLNSARDNLTAAYIAAAKLKYGNDAGPEIIQDAQNRAKADIAERHIESLLGSNDPNNIALANQLMRSPDAQLLKGPRYDNLSFKLQHLDNKMQDDAIVRQIFGNTTPGMGRAAPAPAAPGGAPSDYSSRVIHNESGGDPSAQSQTSSATGPGQFIDSTWLSLVKANAPEVAEGKSDQQILAMRSDPDLSKRMIDVYAGQNRDFLKAQNLPTDPGSLYLAHFLGAQGAAEVLKASPDTPLSQIVSPQAIAANPTLRGMTAGGLRQQFAGKMAGVTGDGAAPAANPDAPPGFPTREDLISRIPQGLNDEQYERVFSGVNRQYNRILQATSAERAQVEQQYKGGLAMLQDGRDFNYDPNQIRRLFPRDTADQMISDLQDAHTVGQQLLSVRGMSIPEIADQTIANQQILNNSTGDGYVRQRKLSDAFDKAAAQHIQQLSADPANYLATNNPDIYAARQAMAAQQTSDQVTPGQPSPAESYAAKMLAEQERLGVPADGRHVLGLTEATQMVQGITKNPEGAPAALKGLEQQWGSAWPEVWRDLSLPKFGALPVNYQMVGALDNPADGALLARALGQATKEGGNKALDNLVDHGVTGKTQPSLVTKAYIEGDEDVQQYARSLVLSGASPDQVQGIVSSIDLLAKAKLLYGGETDPTTAATKAISSAIGKFEFLPNGGARIPRANAPAIEQNAGSVVQGLDLGQLQAPRLYRDNPEDMFTDEQNLARNQQYAKPGPYLTTLPPDQEQQFQAWVKNNNVNFHQGDQSYDMRGFWQAQQAGDPNAKSTVNPNDKQVHYPDTFKTPYAATFSNESRYAQPNAPRWEGDRYLAPNGQLIYDDKAGRWYGQGARQTPGSATADDWLRVLKASPNWITVGNSIRLMDNGGRFVRKADGGFVEVPFNVAAPPAPAQPAATPLAPPF